LPLILIREIRTGCGLIEFRQQPWLTNRPTLQITGFIPHDAAQPMAEKSPFSLVSEFRQDAQQLQENVLDNIIEIGRTNPGATGRLFNQRAIKVNELLPIGIIPLLAESE
jgi:hypothetical protein